jgi:hypothetical protein
MLTASSIIVAWALLAPPAQGTWPPRATVEELNVMVKAGNYHLVRREKVAHQIEAVGVVSALAASSGGLPVVELPGGWHAWLHNVPPGHGLKVGDRVRFRALITDEAYELLQLWTYTWSREPAAAPGK